MAVYLYDLAIFFLRALYRLAAIQNAKAKLFISGRSDFFGKLTVALQGNTQPLIWMHCASLGEFEQGRPVLEMLKKDFPSHKIMVTFFSPSGYEARKTYPLADYIFYLPWDTPDNARRFIDTAKPVMALFVKYEFWYHYITELHRRNIPVLNVSGVFHSRQVFFKWYGKFFRKLLLKFNHFFVQNTGSARVLQQFGINRVTVAGDTRFDRVWQLIQVHEKLPVIEQFKGSSKLMVVGSSWPEDMDVLLPFIHDQLGYTKFIIAPHEISESGVRNIERQLTCEALRYSVAHHIPDPNEYEVLIIDNIGMLARLYRYAEYAWVGGGYGKGLHNILEAAAYGMPVFFGNKNLQKFPEAIDLINRGGAFAVADYTDLKDKFEAVNDPATYLMACEITRLYVEEKRGATQKIITYCHNLLNA